MMGMLAVMFSRYIKHLSTRCVAQYVVPMPEQLPEAQHHCSRNKDMRVNCTQLF